jgi:ATP-dependent helicase/DNAse subunit B
MIENSEPDELEAVNLYQVVLAGRAQKLVFCPTKEYFTKLQNYARNCFKADTNISSGQLSVNPVTKTKINIAQLRQIIQFYIRDRR